MDDDFVIDNDYISYLSETQEIRSNLSFGSIGRDNILSVPVYRHDENMPENAVVGPAKHIVFYNTTVHNTNPDTTMCSDEVVGRLDFQVLTDDVPGVPKGHIFRFLEDAQNYDRVYSIYKQDSTSRTGLQWWCDNPCDRYMLENYMPNSGEESKLSMSESAADILERRMAQIDSSFEHLMYDVDGKMIPILSEGSSTEFFKNIKTHMVGKYFGTQRNNEQEM